MWKNAKQNLNRAWSAVASFFSVSTDGPENPTLASPDNAPAPLPAPQKHAGQAECTQTPTLFQTEERHAANAKLTYADVVNIRHTFAKREVTKADLARHYNVSESAIGRLLNGHTWKVVRTKKLSTKRKLCLWCGTTFQNRRGPSEARIGPQRWNVVKFCSRACSYNAQRAGLHGK